MGEERERGPYCLGVCPDVALLCLLLTSVKSRTVWPHLFSRLETKLFLQPGSHKRVDGWNEDHHLMKTKYLRWISDDGWCQTWWQVNDRIELNVFEEEGWGWMNDWLVGWQAGCWMSEWVREEEGGQLTQCNGRIRQYMEKESWQTHTITPERGRREEESFVCSFACLFVCFP